MTSLLQLVKLQNLSPLP